MKAQKAIVVFGREIVKGWIVDRSGVWWIWRSAKGGNLWNNARAVLVAEPARGIEWALGWEGKEADALRAYRGLVA